MNYHDGLQRYSGSKKFSDTIGMATITINYCGSKKPETFKEYNNFHSAIETYLNEKLNFHEEDILDIIKEFRIVSAPYGEKELSVTVEKFNSPLRDYSIESVTIINGNVKSCELSYADLCNSIEIYSDTDSIKVNFLDSISLDSEEKIDLMTNHFREYYERILFLKDQLGNLKKGQVYTKTPKK